MMQRLIFCLAAVFFMAPPFAEATPAESHHSEMMVDIRPVAHSSSGDSDPWPQYPPSSREHEIERGPGGYLSLTKLLLLWVVFLCWVKSCDWINRDTYQLKLNYALWNSVAVFPFLVGMLIFALGIPFFIVGFFLLLLTYLGPFVAYVMVRNKQVGPHAQVFTRDHFRHLMARRASKVGVKMDAEKKAAHQQGAPIEFISMGGANDQENQANIILARQSPAYLAAKEFASDAITHRADRMMLDFTSKRVAASFQIDGVWHERQSLAREEADPMLAVFKKLANLNIEERRARQEGQFAAKLEKQSFLCNLVSQGTKTGERVVFQLQGDPPQFSSLADLGMREKLVDKLKEGLAQSEGLVLLSAMPSGGHSLLWNWALRSTDRLMRDFVAVEDAHHREADVENIEVTTFDLAAGLLPNDVLTEILRKEPEVVAIPSLADGETAETLCNLASNGRLAITSIRAKEATEALLRVLLLKTPAASFAPAVSMVVNVRLVRKLCDECKEAYEPTPELLKKLNIPPGTVRTFYRPPTITPETEEEICSQCLGIGFHGRTGIYELLVMNDHLREALVKQPKLEVLRQVAKKTGNRSLQEEGIVLVAKGVTSLPELLRVMKQ